MLVVTGRVNCNGTEASIEDCPFYKNNAWGVHTCSHWEDAGVTCYNCKSCVALSGKRVESRWQSFGAGCQL